ncbi:MAG: hypothetical protein ABFR89_11640 [Actinomycetota bacterium]
MDLDLRTALEPVRGLPVPWYVAGGWAIDLFVDRVTRDHHDVDILVARDDQGAVFDHFSDRTLFKVIPHPCGRVGQGTLVAWDGRWLKLPIHQVFADDAAGNRIETLFGEIDGGIWRYRRNPKVKRRLADAVLESKDGIAFLAPEIVLLFKAPLMREWDESDFATALPLMTSEQRKWLANALRRSHRSHPWLRQLS